MMLVDTHVLVWAVENNPRLGAQARHEVDTALANDTLAISAISFWEIAMLVDKERLEVDEALDPWRQRLLDAGLVEIPIRRIESSSQQRANGQRRCSRRTDGCWIGAEACGASMPRNKSSRRLSSARRG